MTFSSIEIEHANMKISKIISKIYAYSVEKGVKCKNSLPTYQQKSELLWFLHRRNKSI